MGLDSQWLAALTGDNFGASGIAAPVNGVASEPTQPMADNNSWQENSTYRPGYAEPTPNSEAPANLGRAMQKKWHTFIDIQASEDVTPDSSRGRLEVDENCHRTLADRLRQHISVPEPVPPTSFLVSQKTTNTILPQMVIRVQVLTRPNTNQRTWPSKPTFRIFTGYFPSFMRPPFSHTAKTGLSCSPYAP